MEPTDTFVDFIRKIGLQVDVAQNLWKENIRSPQELAGCKKEKLCGIVDNALLLDHIHPVLQKFTFPITIASDPYEKALSLLRSEGCKCEGTVSQSNCKSTVQCDAIAFVENDEQDVHMTKSETPT